MRCSPRPRARRRNAQAEERRERDGIDYEVEYNESGAGSGESGADGGLGEGCGGAIANSRAARLISYGPGARNTIDLFSGDGKGPIVVFIHGGYWQALDGSSFSHCARGLNAHGIDVAVPSYDLCPQVSVDTIIQEMRAAVRVNWLGLAGRS